MIKKVVLQPAIVLHKRPYKETSFLVDFFTRDYGKISAIAQGARRPKSLLRETFTPFAILLITYSGRNDLKKLFESEVDYRPQEVSNFTYSCLIYVNELIMSFLQKEDPYLNLFESYVFLCRHMAKLNKQSEIEILLRRFELTLLQEIGYGIDLKHEANSENRLKSDLFYKFDPSVGFFHKKGLGHETNTYFQGKNIIKFSEGCFDELEVRKTAKLITRHALDYHLNGKEIKSRNYFNRQ